MVNSRYQKAVERVQFIRKFAPEKALGEETATDLRTEDESYIAYLEQDKTVTGRYYAEKILKKRWVKEVTTLTDLLGQLESSKKECMLRYKSPGMEFSISTKHSLKYS